MRIDDELAVLNDAQSAAVTHLGSPLLILAGPGSGKTRVITLKIAWLINELQVRPHNILAITFTNKAAKEMKTRVQQCTEELIPTQDGRPVSRPFISTFHSCGAYLLRKFCQQASITRDFQIYDSAEQLELLKEANPNVPANQLSGIMHGISKAKDYGLTPEDGDGELSNYVFDNIECYKNYEKLKARTGNLDFGDLLIRPHKLIEKYEEVKNHIRTMWKWFFVDEYQDTNTIQSKWLYTLCNHTANLAVVGDDDQSIYGFRGAVVENILQFETVFSNTKVITLGQNYRSTPQIVSLANEVIANNYGRHGKTVFSNKGDGELPQMLYFLDERDEEAYVVEQSLLAQEAQESLAVFYRINSQSRGYEMALQKAKIPYDIASLGFFDRLEVKDAIALLRVYKNAHDIISFLRIANKPSRGIGKASVVAISEKMKEGYAWNNAWRMQQSKLSKQAQKGLQYLEEALEIASSNLGLDTSSNNTYHTVGEVLRALLEGSLLYSYFEAEDEKSQTERIVNIEELISYTTDYQNNDEGWQTFFEQIGLNEANTKNSIESSTANSIVEIQKVQLTTLHRAKGLEFDRVIICGLEDGLIPMTSMYSINDEELEEERRVFYIGITRAKSRLAITCCNTRRKYGRTEVTTPSPFLREFDRNLVEWVDKTEELNSFGRAMGNSARHSETAMEVGGHNGQQWQKGDRVKHSVYGMGYVRTVKHSNTLVAIEVEFDNEYEASFVPKFTTEIEKI